MFWSRFTGNTLNLIMIANKKMGNRFMACYFTNLKCNVSTLSRSLGADLRGCLLVSSAGFEPSTS
jgi:hypothetical protein